MSAKMSDTEPSDVKAVSKMPMF